jgi:hypothetical protein
MIRVESVFDDSTLDDLQLFAATYPDIMQRYVRHDLVPFVRNEVTRRLRREPGAVVYPIQWTSEKQRLAFFATNGFGHGIPYERKNVIEHDWHVIGDYTDTLSALSVFNESPDARYIYGDEEGQHQQQFHINTGWPTFAEEIAVIAGHANDRFLDAWPGLVSEALQGRSIR